MNISEYAVKNYQFTIIIFVMVIVLGLATIFTMPRSEDPEVSDATFPVVVIYPGTSPKDLENFVVKPIEEKLSSLENIRNIKTKINDGVAIITVRYMNGVNVDNKYQEVIREVNNLKSQLPPDIFSIDIQKWLPSNVNVLQIALVSENASYDKLKENADNLKDDLEKLPSLKNVKIYGIPEKKVQIELKFDKMNQMNIPLDAIYSSIQTEALNIPGGSINAGSKTFNINTSGNYKNISEIQNTIVYSANGKNILLKDIANVYFEYENEKHITRLNTHKSIYVVAAQKPGENITNTQKTYLPVIEKFKKTLPNNIDLVHTFDQAENVNKRLGGLGIDFIIAIALVSITLLPLGGRAAIIVMISIPLSLSIGLVFMNILGYSLNQLSIVGFVVSLGLLVDDSIVVVENIERWILEGNSRFEAVIKGTKQISLAVLGCTATLITAFLPLVLLPGGSGDFIRSLPMSVITSVIASLVVSLTIIPFLSSKILKESTGNSDGNIFLRGFKKVINKSYSRLLDKALNKPVITVVIAVCIFVASLYLFKLTGSSLFPASEKPQFLIEIITPLQSSIEYTNNVTKEIEKELLQHKEIKYFSTNIGKGNPQVYYNVIQENERSDFAQIFIQLDDKTEPAKKLELIEFFRNKWTPYVGAKIEVKDLEQGPPMVAPVEVKISGENLDSLRNLALKVENMLKETEGTIYVKNPVSNLKSDIRVVVNKEKAQSLGIPTINIDKTVRLAVAGFNVGNMIDDEGKNYNILITKEKGLDSGKTNSLENLKNLFVSARGSSIPLNQVAELQFESSPVVINHLNKIRTVSISAFVKKGYLVDNVNMTVDEKMSAINLPSGYNYQMGGEVESREESFGGFTSVIIITIFIFLAILILEFKSFKNSVIVLSVIPLGVVGAASALFISGNSLSFVAFIGLIALAGIEVKNTILLVDFTNQLRKSGKSIDEAIREAGEIRFLPIIFTSLTAIGGMTPIAMSTNPLLSPLAIVIIGGLISSTLLSRIVTPVLYKLINPKVI